MLTEVRVMVTPYNIPYLEQSSKDITLLILNLNSRRGGWSSPRPNCFTSQERPPLRIVNEVAGPQDLYGRTLGRPQRGSNC